MKFKEIKERIREICFTSEWKIGNSQQQKEQSTEQKNKNYHKI